jgi:voltage-gated potassium channel Kch
MNQLGTTHLVKVGDKEIICRELTVAGARALFSSERSGDMVTDALFKELRLTDIELMTSLSASEIDQMLPSQLAEVVEGCKKANPDFFGFLDRLAKT